MENVNWEIFFIKAGIGEPTVKDYAKIFEENKISSEILKCLNQNFLKSMGIRPIGDIIRILEYIKIIKIEKTSKPKEMFDVKITDTPPTKKFDVGVNGLIRQSCSTYENNPGWNLPVNGIRVVSPASEGRVTIVRPIQPANIKFEPKLSNQPLASPGRIVIISNSSQLKCKPVAYISKQSDESSVKCNKKSEKSWCVNVNIDENDTDVEMETLTMSEVGERLKLEVHNGPILQRPDENLHENSPLIISRSQKSPTKYSQLLHFPTEGSTEFANNDNNQIRSRKKYNRTTKEIREVIIRTMNSRISPKEIGKLLDVSERTVYKFQRQYRFTGSIESKERIPRKPRITPEAEEYIRHLIDLDCTLTLREISEKLKSSLGFHASVTSLTRYLSKMKYTFKKVSRANGGMVIEGTNRQIHGYRVTKKY